ncbi:MAG TPA: type II secretion system F family protein [Miltoncostaeaceae bacterium]|nr:type II secretion system F family protein [Miltoncostaeaceae bacterium]
MTAAPLLMAGASLVLLGLGMRRMVPATRAGHLRATRTPGWIARSRPGRGLAARLDRAGAPVGLGAALALAAATTVLAALGAFVVIRTPVAAVAGGVAAAGAGAAYLRSADRRHLDRLEAQLPGVAQGLSASLGAGLSLRHALARAARDAPDPARAELARCVAELELGGRIDDVLESLAARVPARELRIMTTAILVQRRTGGNLALALGRLSDRLEERAQLARELRGATAQARMTAWLVAALPLAGGALTEMVAPGTLARDLGQGPGPYLLGAALTLYAAGVVLIRRVGRVEP